MSACVSQLPTAVVVNDIKTGYKVSYLCLYEFKNRLWNHFGSEYSNSMVDVAASRRVFEASGWTFVLPKSNESFTITFSKATCVDS